MNLRTEIKAGAIGMLFSVFFLFFSMAPQKADAQQGVSISFQMFYNDLAPYGNWYNDPQYGYVWAPRVANGFRPYYTNGYWVNTDYGNMWMSNYAWGWAAFHYGRWAYSNMYGWIWIPGDEWGPAWVTWRQGGGYYGWAPMGPGISINLSFGPDYYVPDNYWTFIPYGYLYSRNFYRHYAPRRSVVIIRNTTIINNTYVNNRNRYVSGPRRRDVEKVTGRSIKTYRIGTLNAARNSRLNGNTVAVYRPPVRGNTINGTRVTTSRNMRNNARVAPSVRNNAAVHRGFVENNNEKSIRMPRQTKVNTVSPSVRVNRTAPAERIQRTPTHPSTPSVRRPVENRTQVRQNNYFQHSARKVEYRPTSNVSHSFRSTPVRQNTNLSENRSVNVHRNAAPERHSEPASHSEPARVHSNMRMRGR